MIKDEKNRHPRDTVPYFKWLIDDENPGLETDDGVENQGMTNKIVEEVHEALGGTKCGKDLGTAKIQVEAWECIHIWVQPLCRLVNRVLKTAKIGEEAFCANFENRKGDRK